MPDAPPIENLPFEGLATEAPPVEPARRGMSDEHKAKMAEGRQRAKRERAEARARGEDPPRARARAGKKKPHRAPTPPPSGVGAAAEPTDSELTQMLSEMLSAPAIPAALILHCDYCTEHFVTQAPATAANLVRLSAQNPGLRKALVRMYAAYAALTYGGVIAAYVGKPLLHHLAPDDVYAPAAAVLGMPPRPPRTPPASSAPVYDPVNEQWVAPDNGVPADATAPAPPA